MSPIIPQSIMQYRMSQYPFFFREPEARMYIPVKVIHNGKKIDFRVLVMFK